MSLNRLPVEVPVQILRLALTSDKPITTSIQAYNVYQNYLDCILSERTPRRDLPISPLLLSTSRRWYRLGSPFLYPINTPIIIRRELGPFAKRVGFHNSKSIRSVELTIHHKDLTSIPKISLLNKVYYNQVESIKVILSKCYKIHKNGLTASQKAQDWTSVRFMMMKMGGELRDKMETRQRQRARWKIVGEGEWAFVDQKADHGSLSTLRVLGRLSMPRKIRTKKKNKGVSTVEGTSLPSKTTLCSVMRRWMFLGGGGREDAVSEDRSTGEGSEEAAVIDTGPLTPDTMPEIMPENTPELGNVAGEEMDIGEGSMETTNLNTGLPTPYTMPELIAEPTAVPITEMLPLPDLSRQS